MEGKPEPGADTAPDADLGAVKREDARAHKTSVQDTVRHGTARQEPVRQEPVRQETVRHDPIAGSSDDPLDHPIEAPSTHDDPIAPGLIPRPHWDAGQNALPAAPQADVYGALDLGTNNCRLLLARPSRRGFRVVDAFSRIIRLGEGVSQTGQLSEPAMRRTIEALRVCAGKIQRHRVGRARLVATEACRVASNGAEFLDRVEQELGLKLEMLSRRDEARLAVAGCASLIDPNSEYALVFDIGGGSSELIWLDLTKRSQPWRAPFASRTEADEAMMAWTSLPVGVVTLAETFGGREVTPEVFEAMVDHVTAMLTPFEAEHNVTARILGRRVHLLGTSGTVTTVAGILLGLSRYDRSQVDGCWLKVKDAQAVTYDLLGRTYEQRIAEPCIGRDRADLVLAGCAILEALLRQWPCENLRVADRGLREGILTTLMSEDGIYRPGRRRRGTK
ncbi:MAG: Ppx/GppA phosphatase family protein [Hyphomicrobiaceae bacterium]